LVWLKNGLDFNSIQCHNSIIAIKQHNKEAVVEKNFTEYREEVKLNIFAPEKLPTVKCTLKSYTEVRENGFLIKKGK